MNKWFFIIAVCCIVMLLCRYGYFMSAQSLQAKRITIGLAGDVMLGRLVNAVLQEQPPTYPWGDMLSLVKQPDVTLINLETALTTIDKPVQKVFNFRSDPKNVEVLKVAEIDIVSLANNHIKDFGDEGLRETIGVLDVAGIAHVGAGETVGYARQPVILVRNGVKIGFIGATDNEPGWKATKISPGINYFSVEYPEQLIKDIKWLKQQVDVVVLSLHWGPNMQERPSQAYQDAAHVFIDAGADIIHGHSAHIFQGIERYNGKLIVYDTGDFIDDYHVDETLRNDRSFFYIINVSLDGMIDFQLIPVLISAMQVNRARGEDYVWSMNRIKKLSAELGTVI